MHWSGLERLQVSHSKLHLFVCFYFYFQYQNIILMLRDFVTQLKPFTISINDIITLMHIIQLVALVPP